ncbi:MAG: recombinase family protein [Desulfovibrionaceae bacterium]|nr:recombinase family protein [Desulfovibrionaceae bacterium]
MRCAIYTRKSTEDGLEQEFNSLDAQREASEAYIASQKSEGWVCLPDRYDDGGFTGGNTDRPALQRLLEDINENRIDCVVVYKVDRLSRSLLDFARLIDIFERKHITFVSVTQQFSTSNSMGRLTLNILLSFAQFEREIIAERTRDKMGASRRKGKWVGGIPFLGYDIAPGGGRLIVNEQEAEMVRTIFKLYISTGSMNEVLDHLNKRNWRTKEWTSLGGVKHGGKPFTKAILYKVINNIAYLGKIEYEGKVYEGEQDRIVSIDDWENAHALLKHRFREGKAQRRNKYGELLRDLLRCRKCGNTMIQKTSRKPGRMYRYYVCTGGKAEGCDCRSLHAAEVESMIVQEIKYAIQKAGIEHEVYEAFLALCGDRLKVLKLEEKMLTEQVDRLNRHTAAAIEKRDMEEWEKVKSEAAKAEEELMKTIRHKRILQGQLPSEQAVAQAFNEWDTMWSHLDIFDQSSVIHQLINQIDYDAAKGTLAISYEIK